MPGPPRKPHRLRVLEGGGGARGRGKHRPLTPDHPAPSTKLPCPRGFTADLRAEWRRHVAWLRELKLESGVDAAMLEGAVRMLCRARQADRELAKAQRLTITSDANGSVRHPAVSISRECWRDYAQFAARFGLSPADRAKLGQGGAEQPEKAGDVPAELRDVSGG